MRALLFITGIALLCAVAMASLLLRSAEWSYAGANGPENWHRLSPSYALCQAGQRQSPIDLGRIRHPSIKQLDSSGLSAPIIKIAHHEHVEDIVDDGHTIQVSFDPGNFLSLESGTYELKQLHFHSPSEHRWGDKAAPLEMHVVFQSSEEKFAVMAVFIKAGLENSNFAYILKNLPAKKGAAKHVEKVDIDLDDLIPVSREIIHYEGSLTTPPCLENVEWLIFTQPIEWSKEQIDALSPRLHHNARPVQQVGARRAVLESMVESN